MGIMDFIIHRKPSPKGASDPSPTRKDSATKGRLCMKKTKIKAIDLFCGAGGLTRGLLDAGVEVKAGYDIDTSCEFPYNANNDKAKFIKVSVDDVSGDDIQKILGKSGIRLIAGCAPCQPFSKYRQGKDNKKDNP